MMRWCLIVLTKGFKTVQWLIVSQLHPTAALCTHSGCLDKLFSSDLTTEISACLNKTSMLLLFSLVHYVGLIKPYLTEERAFCGCLPQSFINCWP